MNTQAAVPLNVKENVNYESVLKRTPEKKIMSLHRAMRANYKNIFYLLCLIAAALFFFIMPGMLFDHPVTSSGTSIGPGVFSICGRIMAVLAVLEFFWMLIWAYQRRYKLTDQRLVVINGIIARVKKQVCLVRVKDINLYQSFVQRFLDIGTIEVLSSDESIGLLKIEHVGRPELFYEQLYNAWQVEIKNKGLIWW